MSWHNKREGYQIVREDQAIKSVSEGVNFEEKMDFQKHKQLLALIDQMKERDTKANMQNLTTEFNKIWL
jgi:hypothetical protein